MPNKSLLWLLAYGNFVIGIGAFVVIGILSPIADGLGISIASAGLVMTVYAAAYAISSPLVAALTGSVARKLLLLTGLGLFLAGTIATALAPSLIALAGARLPTALGAALFTPIAAGVAVAISPPEMRGRALAIVFSGLTIAQVLGIPMGSWLALNFGWQSAFMVVAALAVAGFVLVAAAVPKDIAFPASSLADVLAALTNFPVMLAVLYTSSMMIAVYQVFTFFGPMIEANVGRNPELITFYLVLYGSGAVVGNAIGGFLTDRIGSLRTLGLLTVAQAVLLAAFVFTPIGQIPFAVLVVVWSLFGWSFMAPQQTRLVNLAPKATSLVLGLNAAAIYLGISIGSPIASAVLSTFGIAALGVSGGILALLALLHLVVSARISGDR